MTIETENEFPAQAREADLGLVRAFWNVEACGTHLVDAVPGTQEFYEQYRRVRFESEWHIPLYIPFSEGRGKSVLEIGCGNGADGVLWAENGADYTGVDLTQAALDATRKHFETLGLRGTFQRENAEALSFPDESFDIVYSYGVLHHTQYPERAFAEVYRVLKPAGRAIIMLYHRNSFNYYARIMGYMRIRMLIKILSRCTRWSADRRALLAAGQEDRIRGVRGNKDRSVWQIHYESFLRSGWKYLKADQFVHHCTDGPECPFAFVYSKSQARGLFARFSEMETRVAHFPLRKYPFGKHLPKPIERVLASSMGWYLILFLRK